MESRHIDVTETESVSSNLLDTNDITEGFYIEISTRKKKWILGCSYRLHKRFISALLKQLGKNLDFNSKYDNFILLGDPNVEPANETINDFRQVYDCSNIVKHFPKILPAFI